MASKKKAGATEAPAADEFVVVVNTRRGEILFQGKQGLAPFTFAPGRNEMLFSQLEALHVAYPKALDRYFEVGYLELEQAKSVPEFTAPTVTETQPSDEDLLAKISAETKIDVLDQMFRAGTSPAVGEAIFARLQELEKINTTDIDTQVSASK